MMKTMEINEFINVYIEGSVIESFSYVRKSNLWIIKFEDGTTLDFEDFESMYEWLHGDQFGNDEF